jgi:hypothetical protein
MRFAWSGGWVLGVPGLYMRARLEEYCDGGLVVRREDEGKSLRRGGHEDACLLRGPRRDGV